MLTIKTAEQIAQTATLRDLVKPAMGTEVTDDDGLRQFLKTELEHRPTFVFAIEDGTYTKLLELLAAEKDQPARGL